MPVDTVDTAMKVGYAHFAFSGTVTVEVVAREPIVSFDLSPHRLDLDAVAHGNVLSFQLSQPRKLHLKVNDLSRFFIFADAPEASPPVSGAAGVYDLRDYGAFSSADAVQTKTLQKAIDDVAAKRGVLSVPPGIYRSGELRMKSGLTLYLHPGAIIKGTTNTSDYPNGQFGTQQIYFLDCRNVTILGRGVIDGQGRALRLSMPGPSSEARMKLVRTYRASHCVVEDVILRDPGSWSVHLIESCHVRFSRYKLISNSAMDDRDFPSEPNTDGFDPDNSSHVLIEEGFVSCHDDAIAVKLRYGNRRDMEDVQFRDNVVWTAKSALKLGTEMYDHRITDVVFSGNDVVHADRGIVLYNYRGATIEHPKWVGNYFERIGDNIKQKNIDIHIRDVAGKGHVNNILIMDNTFEHFSPKESTIRGLDLSHMVDGVLFDNLVIAGRKRHSLQDAKISVGPFVEHTHFK